MKVLITGGAGFIGRRFARALTKHGHRVVVLDCLDPQVHIDRNQVADYLESIDVELQIGSVCDGAAVSRSLAGVDAVVHLAAQTGVGQSMYRVAHYVAENVAGTGVLLDAIAEHSPRPSRVVLASSRAVYGEGARTCERCGPVWPGPRRLEDLERGRWEPRCPECGDLTALAATQEDAPLSPSSVYAMSKESQESLLGLVAPHLGIDWVALRFSNVYGAGQPLHNPYTGVLAAFANAARSNKPIGIYEDGNICRDFVHVDDVVEALRSALINGDPGSVYNIGSGEQSRLDRVATIIIETLESRSVVETTGQFRVGDIRTFHPALERAGRSLGYEPQVPLLRGITDYARWSASASGQDFDLASAELLDRGLLRTGERA